MPIVNKTEHNNNVKDNLYKELIENFTSSFKDIMKDYQNELFFKGKEKTQKDIARELEISEQALINYTSDRIPDKQLLPVIRQYFDVPYSTLFGEISSKDLENAKNELNIGLNENSINKLSAMQRRAMNDNISTNYEDKFKIFLINSFINDETLIRDLSITFANYLGKIEMQNKLKKRGINFKNPKDDYYLINLYRFISSIEKRFDNLANDTPQQIKELAFRYAEKYAGEYQKYFRD